MVKNSQKKVMILLSGLIVVFSILFFLEKSHEKHDIYIGVPLANNKIYRYDLLKKDLEKQFNVEVNFVDLYKDIKPDDTEQNLMEDICTILKMNEVDMVLGVPSHQLEYAVNDKLLLEITDEILNLENMHKGVIDRSKKMGDGKLYYVSPIVNHISLLFQNKKILQDLNMEPLPKYMSWGTFVNILDKVQECINDKNLEYYPLALSVKNANEDILFSAYDFQTLAYGLDSKIFENNEFSERWKNFYRLFAKIIYKYGKDLEEMNNGIYPKNYIYVKGNYAFMLGESYDVEVFLNKSFNEEYNRKVPVKVNPDFPIEISYINYDGSKTQNFRDASISINQSTLEKELTLKILNYFLSKEYAYKIIDTREEYSHFSNSLFSYPTYYDEDIIAVLNKSYGKNFDAHLFYDIEYGSRINNTDQTNDTYLFDTSLNEGFTMIYNNRENKEINNVIEEALEYTQNKLKKRKVN